MMKIRRKPSIYINLLYLFLIAVSTYATVRTLESMIQQSNSPIEIAGYSVIFIWTLSVLACFLFGMFLSNSK